MVRYWIVGLVVTGWWLSAGPTLAGEDRFPVLEGPYLGQQEPGVQAQPFALRRWQVPLLQPLR